MTKSAFLIILFAPLLTFAQQKKYVVLSGGGSPAGNHYSQYLQTHLLADHLQRISPMTDVFFAAGNRPNQNPVFADVHREITTTEGIKHEMSVGTIRGNRPAMKANFLNYVQTELARSTSLNSTLFLFVSDHGMPNLLPDGRPDISFANNCIDMWSVRRENNNSITQLPWIDRCLSRIELQQALLNQSKAARNVFVMSQCFSGGFHRMSVDIQPEEINANSRICGFTAVTEDTTASGCTPDVSGPSYQGYERFMTQQLTGRDVVTGRVYQPPRNSVRDAHEFATLEDFTVDIPLSTSDFFLWKWSILFDQPGYVPRTGNLPPGATRKLFRDAFLGTIESKDPAFARRRNFVRLMNQRTLAFDRVAGSIVNAPNPEGPVNLFVRLSRESEGIEAQYYAAATQKERLMTRTLIPAWERDVVRSNSPILTDSERALEQQAFLTWEKTQEPFQQNLLWLMSLLKVSDSTRADQVSLYESQRDLRRLNWARQSSSPDVRTAAGEIQKIETYLLQKENEMLLLQKRIGLIRRSLIYRSALAAWVVLEKTEDEVGLNQLKGLLECESSTLL